MLRAPGSKRQHPERFPRYQPPLASFCHRILTVLWSTSFTLPIPQPPTPLTKRVFGTHWSCIGEGNGNPLQCSCLENPRGGGAWWAAVYGVAQSPNPTDLNPAETLRWRPTVLRMNDALDPVPQAEMSRPLPTCDIIWHPLSFSQ